MGRGTGMDRVGRGSGSLSLAVRAQQEGPGGKQRGRERVRCELCSHGRYSDGEDDRFTNESLGTLNSSRTDPRAFTIRSFSAQNWTATSRILLGYPNTSEKSGKKIGEPPHVM